MNIYGGLKWKKISDVELLNELKTDVNCGYPLLVDSYIGLVYTIVNNKLCSVCSKEDIEEIISDIFYQFYTSIKKVDLSKGNIKAYLSVIAKRRAINQYIKATKSASDIPLDNENIADYLVCSDGIETGIGLKETKKELLESINRLGPPDNEIIVRKFYLGQTMKEIADDINLKTATVKKRYERALKKLRIQLGGYNNAG